jgi:hypothetical protein
MRYKIITTDGKVLLDEDLTMANVGKMKDIDGKMKQYRDFDMKSITIDFLPGTRPNMIHGLNDIKDNMLKGFNMTLGPNYKGFVEHVEVWNANGIPHSLSDMAELAERYGTEVPRLVDGELVFSDRGCESSDFGKFIR